MREQRWRPRKVVVVGAGAVGSTFAYSLAQAGLADDIALIDENRRFAEGQVLDLLHGQPFYPTLNIHVGEPRDFADAQVIVVTAGAKQRPGQSRLELLRENAVIVERIVGEVVAQESKAVLILVTNPVDILTYVAAKKAGWERGRIMSLTTKGLRNSPWAWHWSRLWARFCAAKEAFSRYPQCSMANLVLRMSV